MVSEAKQRLAQAAFAGFMRGEEPQPVEMATAVTIDRWEAVVRVDSGRRSLILKGDVTNHPVLGTDRISTSEVVWLDRKLQWARTISRVYRLEGKMIDEEGVEL